MVEQSSLDVLTKHQKAQSGLRSLAGKISAIFDVFFIFLRLFGEKYIQGPT